MKAQRRLVAAALAVALLQIGFLTSMIAGRAAILRDGREVLLEVQPVDPRDLLRGDYVMLGYNISSLPRSLFAQQPSNAGAWNAREVYVRLRPDAGGVWQPVSARLESDEATPTPEGEVEIKGVTLPSWSEESPVQIRYGIERFYLPEGQGKPIEADMRERTFRMRVAVAEDGTAQVKAFLDGEKTLFEEPLY